MGLHEEAMLINLSFSFRGGRKTDKGLTEETARSKGANPDDFNTIKKFIKHPLLDKAQSIMTQMRKIVYDNTFPWKGLGCYILARKNYFDLVCLLQEKQQEFWETIEKLCCLYEESWKAFSANDLDNASFFVETKSRLADTFRWTDYPPSIRSFFDCRYSVAGVPKGCDFVVDLGNKDEEKKVKLELDSSFKDAVKDGMESLRGDILETISSLKDRISDPEKRLYQKTFDAVVRMANLSKRMNVEGDEDLEEICDDIIEAASNAKPKVIRVDPEARETEADKVQKIVDKMKDYMGVV